MDRKRALSIFAVLVVIGVGAMYYSGLFGQSDEKTAMAEEHSTVQVVVPKLGQVAKLGEEDFNANCAACHGKNAAGTGNGPPLVHRIYEPNHHADYSFKRAVEIGVRAHHWNFGNMPPQTQVKDHELARIVTYVRELQKANGIY